MKPFFAAALFCVLPALLSAHEFKSGDITVGHPYAFETAPMAQTAAGYLTVTNTGETPDTLLAVEADFPKVMMHQSLEKDGIATMEHVETLEIAPGASVAFAPGGYHVMFMGLNGAAFKAGEHVPATLVFEHAGRIDVEFNVEARTEDAPASDAHSGHATH
ncbi:hypothetical protein P775_27950 [Puniceibacterium antarcticum]|uniref:Copper(I)-binding protein n=1 Tax=Puniceibacterium antarcticum TaxID=1206336 RepID=A0A2G8QX86_9RHOB|nr:copper chaperone PCu(A)C [Puniceibacterium antarcticum]PIL13801.1 hypothetical protein P775_27950 [Puniceibacterium antarcticum]